MKTQTEKRKITVQLWGPLLKKLNELSAAACLDRDAYLEVVFANEALMLLSDLQGKKNSDQARAFIKRCFSELRDLHPVSFTLSAETAHALTAACDQVNVWRDAFVNRVIYILVAKSSAIEDQFGFKFKDNINATLSEVRANESLLLGPRLVAIQNFIRDDPFLAIRAALRAAYPDTEGRLHDLQLGSSIADTARARGLAGFTVFLEDVYLPGTAENQLRQKESEEFMRLHLDDELPVAHQGSK